MKIITTILPLFLFLSFQAINAQQTSAKKTDVEIDGFIGKVKQAKQAKYEAQEKNGEVVQGDRTSYSFDNYLYKYDGKGTKIEENHYNSDGSLEDRYTNKYDDKGNQIEKNQYTSTGSRTLVNVCIDVVQNENKVTVTISAEIIEFTK